MSHGYTIHLPLQVFHGFKRQKRGTSVCVLVPVSRCICANVESKDSQDELILHKTLMPKYSHFQPTYGSSSQLILINLTKSFTTQLMISFSI